MKFTRYWPLLYILALWLAFAMPYFILQRVPFPSTYQVSDFSPWSAYQYLHGPVKNGAMPDIIGQIYPWKKLVIDTWKSGQIPLWNPYSFGGTPLLANYQSGVLSPMNLLFFVLDFRDAWTILILLQPLLAGLFMYLFMTSLKTTNLASIFASVSFMFCGFLTSWMGYGTLGYAILFLPLALFLIEKYQQTHKWFYSLLFSFTIPLSFFSGHFQISIYFIIFVIAYLLYKVLLSKNKKNDTYLILYLLCGILLTLPQVIPSLEFYTQSLRSSLFQKGEAIPWLYFPTLLSPDYFGNPVTRNDWFGHYAEWNSYIGVISIFFSLYALTSKKRREIIFFCISGITALCLAFNTPLLDLLISMHLPVLSTSAASRIIVLFSFSFSVLAGFGLDVFMEDIKEKKIKNIVLAFILYGIVFGTLWMMLIFKVFLPLDKIQIAKSNLKLPTILVFLLLTTTIAFQYKNIRKYSLLLSLIILLLCSVDMYRFTTKWQPSDPRSLEYVDVPVSSFFNEHSGYYRGYGDYGGELSTYYKFPSLQGYDALYIDRYGEFITALSTGTIQEAERSVVTVPKRGLYTQSALNLLGVRYIVHKISDGRASWTFPFWEYPEGILKTVYKDSAFEIFENTSSLPRAFLTSNYIVDNSNQKIINSMFKNKNNSKTIVLEKDPLISSHSENRGTAIISKYTSNIVHIKTKNSVDSLLFLSDPFYKGWKVYVDSKEKEIMRADYAFRSIVVPKGEHLIEFIYDPISFKLGLLGSIGGLLGIIIISFWIKKNVTN